MPTIYKRPNEKDTIYLSNKEKEAFAIDWINNNGYSNNFKETNHNLDYLHLIADLLEIVHLTNRKKQDIVFKNKNLRSNIEKLKVSYRYLQAELLERNKED